MIKNLLNVYYLFVVFTSIYLFSIKVVGYVSIRVPLFFISFFIIISFYKRKKKINLRLLKFPLIFLFFSFVSIVIDDPLQLDLFILDIFFSRFLITYMLVGLTLVLIPYYVSLNAVINILIFVSSVNSIAIIGQFLDIGFFWVLADILTLFSEHAVYDLTTLTRIKGVYLGLVGAVQSGYLLSLLVPLILYKISLRKNRIFWLCFLVINLFVASLVQQRLAFALIIFNISYYIWTIKISKISLLTLVVLFFIVFLSMDFSDLIGDSSRLNTFSDDNRLSLFSTCIIFIINNPIFGGFNSYYLILETSPHNILFNAWIRGGFFGFLAIIIMISIILRKSFRILIDKNIKTPLNNYITLALVNIILISFTHNEGITTYHGFNYILITLFVIINSLPKIDSNSFQEKGSYIKNY